MQKTNITFEQLYAPDIRFCNIVSATDILKNPKKEPSEDNPVKAYHLVVDTGFDTRDIVTNIVDKFSKEDLIGKCIPFVLNLEPSEIRGVLSKGMIVMAGDNLLSGGSVGDKIL